MIPLTALIGLLVSSANSLISSIPGLSQLIQTIVLPRGFEADAIAEEKHSDLLTITENPVEQGAAITDHAFKRPAELTLRIGYSNSSQQSLGDPLYVQIVYALFLALQAACVPFGLITGKRIYQNLLIAGLETFTDEKWEYAMMLTVTLKEIILVSTQVVSVGSAANMAAPGVNGATQNLGSQNLAPGGNFNANAASSLF